LMSAQYIDLCSAPYLLSEICELFKHSRSLQKIHLND
jgi:hypothetical protein